MGDATKIDLAELKESVGLSNKQWDKSLKGFAGERAHQDLEDRGRIVYRESLAVSL